MKKCPICGISLSEPFPDFCETCGWKLRNDPTLVPSLDLPDSAVEEYGRRAGIFRRNWMKMVDAIERRESLEKRIGEMEAAVNSQECKSLEEIERKKLLVKLIMVIKSIANSRERNGGVPVRQEEQGSEPWKPRIILRVRSNTSEQKTVSAAPGSVWVESATGMEFVYVPGGTFEMGDLFGDGNSDEKPVHTVRLDPFYIGKYPVTQRQWKQVTGANPSRFQKGNGYPVEQVSWNEAKEFIQMLAKMNKGKYGFCLPTEAQWEYAARSGGKRERYAGGEDVDSVAWHLGNGGGSTHPVGLKKPNGLGIHDMSGNVWEWCEDVYYERAYKNRKLKNPIYFGDGSSLKNPIYAGNGSNRLFRGGCWNYGPAYARCAYRFHDSLGSRYVILGFRLARTI